MAESSSAKREPDRADRDQRTDRDRSDRDRTELLGFDTAVLSELHRGVSRAISEAFRAYSDEVENDNVFQLRSAGTHLDGVVAGYANLFEELGRTSRRMLDEAKTSRTRRNERRDREAPVQNIDYERLAKLVAAELQKGGVTAKT
jgi:hypothetical protein